MIHLKRGCSGCLPRRQHASWAGDRGGASARRSLARRDGTVALLLSRAVHEERVSTISAITRPNLPRGPRADLPRGRCRASRFADGHNEFDEGEVKRVVRQSNPHDTFRPARQTADLTSQIQLFRRQVNHQARKRELSRGERRALEDLIRSIAELLSLKSW
jgi:hypothetical protein